MQDLELKMAKNVTADETDLEIKDKDQNTLKIGLRKTYDEAGFSLTLFAHVVVLIETQQILKNMQICYKEGRFRDKRPCAGQDQLANNKFIMCNKDVDIVVGIKDQEQRFTYSKVLEVKEGGTPNPFDIVTQPVAN